MAWPATPVASTDPVTPLDDYFNKIGVWQAYTPTLTGVTVGNGTLVGRWTQIGKTVHVYVDLTLGTTSAVTGTVSISLPVAAARGRRAGGIANMRPSTSDYLGRVYASASGGTVALVGLGTNGATTALSSTFPATWSSGGSFTAEFSYEAA